MDPIAIFRASHPGHHQQIVDNATEAERQRCSDLAELAEAAGVNIRTLRDAIENGSTAREAVAQLSRYASNSDETSAAFVKKVERMRLTGGGNTNDPEGAAADAMIARMRGSAASSSSSHSPRAGQQDNGDLVAAAMGLEMPKPAPSASPARSSTQPLDKMDRVAAAMNLAAPAK